MICHLKATDSSHLLMPLVNQSFRSFGFFELWNLSCRRALLFFKHVSDPGLLLPAGRHDRHDRQVLGPERRWAVGARRLRKPGRRCRRSLPTEIHHRVTCAPPSCSHTCCCSPRAEMGTNLTSVDLGAGRTAVAVFAGGFHTCALLVRLPTGRLGVRGPAERADWITHA